MWENFSGPGIFELYCVQIVNTVMSVWIAKIVLCSQVFILLLYLKLFSGTLQIMQLANRETAVQMIRTMLKDAKIAVR